MLFRKMMQRFPRETEWAKGNAGGHTGRSALFSVCAAVALACAALAPVETARAAAPGDEFLGLWTTSERNAVLRTTRCKPQSWLPATSICVTVVYDSRADPLDCYRRVAQFDTYRKGVWEEGWAFDTRARRVYRAVNNINADGSTTVRFYVGSQGKTETFYRVDSVPKGCEGKRPKGHTR